MQNKVTVTIDDREYTLVAAEDADYVKKVAALVGEKTAEVRSSGKIQDNADVAILAAINLADEYFKEMAAEEKLRAQVKEYLEEATDLKMQLSEAKREIFKLQGQGKK